MKIKYTVHSAAEDAFPATVKHNGREITGTVPGLIVELVAEDGSSSPVLRINDDVDKAKALFEIGAVIVATFKKEA